MFEGFFLLGLLFFYRQKICRIIFANLKNLFSLISGFRILVSGFRFPDSSFRVARSSDHPELGGKKCWAGGVAECSLCCCDKPSCGSVAKNYTLYRRILLMLKYRRLVQREIRTQNGAHTFWRLAHVKCWKCHVPIEVKPVHQSLGSTNSEVIYFLLCAVFWLLKKHLCHHPRRPRGY